MNFENANASVIGYSHYKLFYNNQDSCNFYQDENCIIGVVADGCGSGTNSEVGARLGVNFVVNFCQKHFSKNIFDEKLLKNALIEYLKNIIKNQQSNEISQFVEDFLYFTLFGFVVQPHQTFIFCSGDGVYVLNNKEVIIDQNNCPNYITKTLLNNDFSWHTEIIETKKLEQLLVATDGLLHLKETFLKNENVENIKELNDLFKQDDFFENPISLPKFLTKLSTKDNILGDDTSIVMIRNKN